jgi:hypothetical protein
MSLAQYSWKLLTPLPRSRTAEIIPTDVGTAVHCARFTPARPGGQNIAAA